MNTMTKIVALALVALLAFTGFAAATGGVGLAAGDAQAQANGNGASDGTGPIAASAECPRDGSNSPWVTGDERLERFQDRFDLTDDQMDEIQTDVQSLVESDATPEEIRATVTEMLESYGVADPTLGPPADGRQATGPHGHGPGVGQGNGAGGGQGSGENVGQGAGGAAGQGGVGSAGGAGPHGPADGSCLN
jgi:Spy/CpxP family protein refolding chaperone